LSIIFYVYATFGRLRSREGAGEGELQEHAEEAGSRQQAGGEKRRKRGKRQEPGSRSQQTGN
jgi:hypothetical protein